MIAHNGMLIAPHSTVTTLEEKAGDIILFDKLLSQKVRVPSVLYSKDSYPSTRYTPIGVLVIPSSHMFDGTARMMSLRYMSMTDPDNGSIEPVGLSNFVASEVEAFQPENGNPNSEYWEDFFNGETYKPSIVFGTINNGNNLGEYQHIQGCAWCYVMENRKIGKFSVQLLDNYDLYFEEGDIPQVVNNPYDTATSWLIGNQESNVADMGLIPSPYLPNGNPNPVFLENAISDESEPSYLNSLSAELDGKSLTEKILRLATDENWKTSELSYDMYDWYTCVPAMTSWRYHTDGTNQGDWYIPATGELCYLLARLNDIDKSLQKLDGLVLSEIGANDSLSPINCYDGSGVYEFSVYQGYFAGWDIESTISGTQRYIAFSKL